MKTLPRQTPRKLGFLVLALALALCGSGCLGFEKQTVVLFFPKDGDEIMALFVYEGLLVNTRNDDKPQAKDVEEALEDLEELVRGDAVIFGDRLFRAPLKLRANEKLKDDEKKVFDLFQPNVKITKGLFVRTGDKLSYCQPVTLRHPQKVMAGINALISEDMLRERGGATTGLDKETAELFKKSARDGYAWARFDKGRFSVSLPGNPAFFQKLRQSYCEPEVFKQMLLNLDNLDNLEKGNVDAKSTFAKMRQNILAVQAVLAAGGTTPLSLDQRKDTLTIALGYGDSEPFQIQSPFPPRPATHPDLDKELKARAAKMGVPVRADVTIEDVAREFQRSGQLPKQGKE